MISSGHQEFSLGSLRIDRHVLALAAVLSLLVFGVEVFHFTLSIDEEVHTYSTEIGNAWVSQGRWGMALLTVLLPRIGAVPFVAPLLFCLGLSLAATLTAPLLSEDRQERAFFVVLLVVSPIWPHIVEFNTLSFGIGFGLCATSLAVVAVFRDGWRPFAAGALLLGFAIAIYQTLFLSFLVVAFLAAAALPRPVPDTARRVLFSRCARIGLMLTSGIVVYEAVNTTVRLLAPANTYIDGYLNWRDFLNAFAPTLLRTVKAIGAVLGATHPMYLGAGLVFQVLGAAGLAGLGVELARRSEGRPTGRGGTLFLYLAACGAAVLPFVVAAGSAPVRTLVAFPFLFAAVATRALRIHRTRWPQWSVLGLATLTGAWISVSLFYSDAVARQRDAVTAALLASRIDQVLPEPSPTHIPLLVVGFLPPAEDLALRRVEVFGTSFFEHDGGNPWRMAFYLRLMGLHGLEPVPAARLLPIARQVQEMPAWPHPGSVAMVSGQVVVKFGPPSLAQQALLDSERQGAWRAEAGGVVKLGASRPLKAAWDGTPFQLSLAGAAAAPLLSGFHPPEEWGAWTSREQAEVELPFQMSGKVRLRASGWVLPTRIDTPVLFTLGDAGRPLRMTEARADYTLEFEVHEASARLRVSLPTAQPSGIADRRDLGVALTVLRFERL
jgi:Glucosyl transferase GtrII